MPLTFAAVSAFLSIGGIAGIVNIPPLDATIFGCTLIVQVIGMIAGWRGYPRGWARTALQVAISSCFGAISLVMIMRFVDDDDSGAFLLFYPMILIGLFLQASILLRRK
ncbi:hypothetical protein [Nocardia sp. NPDC058666]|uniref:hypothetical protein n=1 Tax=unclassified Nocardia TaxID=2637762 RepID=UPI003653C6F6